MKKYFILIITSFILLLAILFISPKIGKYLEKQQINKINNSIVSIIKKEDLILYQNYKGLKLNIKNDIKKNILKGQGFFIKNNGIIITNNHIVNKNNGNYIIITKLGEQFKAKVLYIDKKSDFSILKINSNKYKGLKLQNQKVFVGQNIYKLNKQTFIKGKIIQNNIKLDNSTQNIIKTSLNLISGDSGTPLFSNNFYVIGINTAKSNQLNKSYSTLISKNQIEQILKKLD